MSSKKRQPKWWQVYVMLPLLVGLFWPEMQLPFTQTEHIIAELGILFLIFGFMQLWLHANRSALMNLDEEEGRWEIKVYEFPPVPLRTFEDVEERKSERPMLQIPAAGVKGVLGDTFEWEAPQEESSVFSDRGAPARKE